MACQDLICGSATQRGGGYKTVQQPRPGYIFAPYVRVGFADGKYITVGNNSQPPGFLSSLNIAYRQALGLTSVTNLFNSAVISNFEYGFEANNSGFQCSIEIVDSAGGSYIEILNYLNKTIADANKPDNRVWFDFGWIIQDKNGTVKLDTVFTQQSRVISGTPNKVTLSFDGGNVKIKFDILAPFAVPAVYNETVGREDSLVDLKTAIRKLFLEIPPQITAVEFRNKDGGELNFKNSQGGRYGPKSVWKMNQQDKLNIARMWLSQYTSENGNSFTFLYDGSTPRNSKITKLIIQEDTIKKNKGADCCNSSIATFVINGGNDSPVISFTPQISWIFGDKSAGGGGSGTSSGTSVELKAQEIQKAGSQQAINVKEHQWYTTPPINHIEESRKAAEAQNTMAQGLGIGRASPFEAELKIFGDPQWYSPIGLDGTSLIGKSFSILFVNPFTPKKTSRLSNLEWLAEPACSTLLSNKNYMIKKVNHQISNGVFVTSFKLHCLLPNADVNFNAGIGSSNETENCGPAISKYADSKGLPKDVNK